MYVEYNGILLVPHVSGNCSPITIVQIFSLLIIIIHIYPMPLGGGSGGSLTDHVTSLPCATQAITSSHYAYGCRGSCAPVF
ncbi:hypothetical protein E2C01_070713 [Portunus trituberculatus]|uniref:Uncharacterized protein n=1 Tax=Portunus trituberculatus TaxID=210409 RepID=A0A5B7I227_PORTR|nr:hypothetical protein [Portunus trituberculatus]